MYCVVCGKEVKFDKKHKKYPMFCSKECQQSELGKQIINEKRRNTQSSKSQKEKEEIKEKRRQTNINKFGVDNPFQNAQIKTNCIEKRKKTNSNKTTEEKEKIKNKIKETFEKKYDTSNPMKIDEIKNKQKQTVIEKYNVDNISKSKEIQEKRKQTNLERYNADNVFKNPEIKSKAKKTIFKKYGYECLFNDPNFKLKITKKQKEKYYDTFISLLKTKKIYPMFSREKYIEYDYNITDKEYFCEICNKPFTSKELKVQKIFCPRHNRGTSNEEKEFIKYMETINMKVEPNKRFYYSKNNYFEIDIFLPDYNLGIEYNGLYWHSDLYKSKTYHKDKYLYFKKLGIDLIQVYDSEWLGKQDIVKSILNAKLGLITNKIQARKCIIKELDNTTYQTFCEMNHIQGYGIAKIRLGLYHNDELVQILSFSKPRYNKKYDWENIRSCTKLNTVVVGGFSKLMKYFTNKYKGSIVSYVDCRYFNGGGYLNNGFMLLNHTDPDYFYFKKDEMVIEHRSKYQKHKLKKILKIFDEHLTEYQNMVNNGYLRVFDAGNLVMVYEAER